ncbi:ABC transporter permease [Planosporangium sp. 12N6]|uniref:ABC transporter permease n=1 Tax=Planosporangium spinosum TaxID=3402278 RepID=UPI003CE6F22D
MLTFAAQMLRHRLGGAVATLVALAVGVMVLMTMGVLVESGLRYRPEPQRYAAADLVVANRDLTVTAKDIGGDTVTTTLSLPEGGTVPAGLVDQIRQVPGVASVVADDSVAVVPLASGAGPAVGHGWSSAALTPYRIVAGNPPTADDEIAIDARLASASPDALRPGQRAEILVGGVPRRYNVTGLAESSRSADPPSVFFTDRQVAALSTHPGRVDAVGVIAAPRLDRTARAALNTAVGRLADAAGATTYAGTDRGLLDHPEALAARALLIQLGGVFGGYVAMLVVCVVAGTVGLSVRYRRRDLALLRAIAATPGQVRRMIMTEAALVSLAAAALGVPAGLLATRWIHGELVDRGFIPVGFPIVTGFVSVPAAALSAVLVAVLSSLIAARRVTSIRPTEALGEVAVESTRTGKIRFVAGMVMLVGAVSSSAFTVAGSGQAALAGAIGMLYLLVIAVALLGPSINRFAARLLAPVLRAVWGASGYLASANLRANAKGMVTVLTALVLSVGFGGSVWFLQSNLQRQTVTQSRDGMLAQRALVGPAGLPDTVIAEAGKIPGVQAVTGVRHTSVVVRMLDEAEVVPAQAVDPDGAAATMDLRIIQGSLADLHGGRIAVSSMRASSQGWKVGDQVNLWLGDGTPARLQVAAIYERGLGFGDITLTRETVAGHTATNLDDQILIRTAPGADIDDALKNLSARYPTSAVVRADELTGQLAKDLAISAWLNKLLVAVMVGYAALAAANTMVMAALARSRELSLLRLVGVTRRQVKRMVHAEQVGLLGTALAIGGAIATATLTAAVNTLTGHPVPYVPPLGLVAVIGGTTLLALVTTVAPTGRLLRIPPIENIGVKE